MIAFIQLRMIFFSSELKCLVVVVIDPKPISSCINTFVHGNFIYPLILVCYESENKSQLGIDHKRKSRKKKKKEKYI